MASGFLAGILEEILGEVAGLFAASKLGFFGKIAGKAITNEKVKTYIGRKAGEFFGQIDESGKTLEEELLTVDLINFLDQVGAQVDDFIAKLRKQDRGEEKVTAFRVFLASGIKKGSRKRKDFVPNLDSKGKSKGKDSEETYDLLDVEWGEKFIKRLLAKSTFSGRVQFLSNQGVFSTMKKVKEPHPTVIRGKELLKTAVEKTIKAAKARSEEIDSSLRANAVDLKTTSETALAKAKAFHENSKRKRSLL